VAELNKLYDIVKREDEREYYRQRPDYLELNFKNIEPNSEYSKKSLFLSIDGEVKKELDDKVKKEPKSKDEDERTIHKKKRKFGVSLIMLLSVISTILVISLSFTNCKRMPSTPPAPIFHHNNTSSSKHDIKPSKDEKLIKKIKKYIGKFNSYSAKEFKYLFIHPRKLEFNSDDMVKLDCWELKSGNQRKIEGRITKPSYTKRLFISDREYKTLVKRLREYFDGFYSYYDGEDDKYKILTDKEKRYFKFDVETKNDIDFIKVYNKKEELVNDLYETIYKNRLQKELERDEIGFLSESNMGDFSLFLIHNPSGNTKKEYWIVNKGYRRIRSPEFVVKSTIRKGRGGKTIIRDDSLIKKIESDLKSDKNRKKLSSKTIEKIVDYLMEKMASFSDN